MDTDSWEVTTAQPALPRQPAARPMADHALGQQLSYYTARPTGPARGPNRALPAVVGERLVRLGHLVGVLALLHRVSAVVGGIHNFPRQLLFHRRFAAGLGVLNEPPH